MKEDDEEQERIKQERVKAYEAKKAKSGCSVIYLYFVMIFLFSLVSVVVMLLSWQLQHFFHFVFHFSTFVTVQTSTFHSFLFLFRARRNSQIQHHYRREAVGWRDRYETVGGVCSQYWNGRPTLGQLLVFAVVSYFLCWCLALSFPFCVVIRKACVLWLCVLPMMFCIDRINYSPYLHRVLKHQ